MSTHILFMSWPKSNIWTNYQQLGGIKTTFWRKHAWTDSFHCAAVKHRAVRFPLTTKTLFIMFIIQDTNFSFTFSQLSKFNFILSIILFCCMCSFVFMCCRTKTCYEVFLGKIYNFVFHRWCSLFYVSSKNQIFSERSRIKTCYVRHETCYLFWNGY